MLRFLLYIPRFAVLLMLMLFAFSSNKHVLDYYLEYFNQSYACVIENDVETGSDTSTSSDKSGEDKKDKNEYFSVDIGFNFEALVKQQLESLHTEISKIFIKTPLSPPPESFLS